MTIGIFDGKMTAGISLILLLSLVAFEYLYTKTILRYLVVVLILLFMVLKRKYFYSLLRTVQKK